MPEALDRPRHIWLRSFYGFGPEDDGYIGWTEEGPRDRMLSLIEPGDLFMIYGASSAETIKAQRHKILGLLQVEARPIRDVDKASSVGVQRKVANGWRDKWSYAIPVTRAWRAEEAILLERIAHKTYRPEAGQAIAVWNPPLLPEEVDLALKIKVKETSVFGEPPLSNADPNLGSLGNMFRPSRAFPGSFGERTAVYEDGPTLLYLARFEGDCSALLGLVKTPFDKNSLFKIGVSNDIKRRSIELNAGFPPAAIGTWKISMVSEPYPSRQAAESAEQKFKDKAEKQMQSLGGEFFRGTQTDAERIFAAVPNVSRFGR